MGNYADKLHRKLASKSGNLPTKEPKRRPGELLPGGFKDIETLIKEGHDPIHAVYVFLQNLTSRFGELVSRLPEMGAWAKAVTEAEDEYLPFWSTDESADWQLLLVMGTLRSSHRQEHRYASLLPNRRQ